MIIFVRRRLRWINMLRARFYERIERIEMKMFSFHFQRPRGFKPHLPRTCVIDFRPASAFTSRNRPRYKRWIESEKEEIGLFLETRARTQVARFAHNNESLSPERKTGFQIRPELDAIMESVPITILLSLTYARMPTYRCTISGASEMRVIAISNGYASLQFKIPYCNSYNRMKYKTGDKLLPVNWCALKTATRKLFYDPLFEIIFE